MTLIRCNRSIPGEYLRAGAVYEADLATRRDIYFRNVERGSGTVLRAAVVRRALKSGAIEITDAARLEPQS